jgi:hypothetical protein
MQICASSGRLLAVSLKGGVGCAMETIAAKRRTFDRIG